MADQIVDIRNLDFIIDEEADDFDFLLDEDTEDLDFILQSYVSMGGTSDYNELINHPYINLVEVIGSKTGPDYGLQNKMDEITNQEIDIIIYG